MNCRRIVSAGSCDCPGEDCKIVDRQPKGFLPREVPLAVSWLPQALTPSELTDLQSGRIVNVAAPSNVILPDHYARFKIEPIRFIVENKLDWFQGNIVKYTCRYDAKNGEEDLKKARRYNEMQTKYLAGDPDWWK